MGERRICREGTKAFAALEESVKEGSRAIGSRVPRLVKLGTRLSPKSDSVGSRDGAEADP